MRYFTTFMLMLLAIVSASAYDFSAENDDGVTIYYNINDDSTASVTLKKYDYKSYSGIIKIPETVTYVSNVYPVTSIGEYAFSGCNGLTSVTIPNTVTSIGFCAFSSCSGLTSVSIPNSVTAIGGNAFSNCSSLTSIDIPNSIISIHNGAFSETALYNDDSNWENNVLYIGNHLIEAKSVLSGAYSIKDGTLTIADYVFSGCNGLTSVTIPHSVTSIGAYAFKGCTGLTSVNIPNSIIS